MAPGFLVQATTLPFVTSPNIIWHSPHVIPFYASIISGAILLLHEGLRLRRNTKPVSNSPSQDEDEERIGHENHATAHGGGCGRVIEVLTLVGSLELLRVSWLRVLALPDNSELVFSVIAFVYTSLLALSTLVYPRSTPSHHITFVLSTTFIVYFIRDVLPLTTYTRSPSDSQYHLWELIIVLSITGILLPLLKPHYHVSPDPNIANANPEQTASPLSLLLFSFLDHTVWKASKLPKLPISELPPLANSDRTERLVELAFPHLDPLSKSKSNPQSHAKKRSIFLSIATTFYKEIILMAILLSFQTLSTLTTPYGLKRLLEYLETNGEGASVKPWVWIASLFLAPFTSTLLAQQYQRTLNRLFIHLEAILTQLVLKHSLRIRINVVGQEEESTTTGTGSSNKSLIGRMNNLISSDLQSISRGSEFLQMVFAPLMVLLCIGFLYTILGWSALVGFAVMLSMMPIPVQVTKILSGSSKELSARSDDRVEAVTETLTVIRMIKLFGWEHKMSQRIEEKRRGELKWVWWNKLYGLLTLVFQFIIPAVTMCVTFAVYALVMKRPLNAATVFSSITLFDLVRSKMYQFFTWLPMIIRAKVSLQRIGSFLSETELLDEFESSEGRRRVQDNVDHAKKIGFKAASFTWSKDNTETTTTTTTTTAPAPSPTSTSTSTSRRSFKLQIDDELLFHRGSINLILGPTGCGKTSMLMALLGEMHFTPTTPNSDSDSDSDSDSWFNLPRTGTSTSSGGGVAYAAQESWVLNASIKDNILFGAPFDEERYNKVLDQCFLTRDLELLPAGDLTEVGEKGLTLSGGQKARVTLARAVYSSAEILLLDDVLAALDVHTAKGIVNKCFLGDLIQGRTVILVTHNVALVSPFAKFIVSIGSDGRILSQGTSISDALAKSSALAEEFAREKEVEANAEQEIIDIDIGVGVKEEERKVEGKGKGKGKLVVEEESGKGHLSWNSLKMYLLALGGRHWIAFWTIFTLTIVLECIFDVLQPWLLGAWAAEYAKRAPEEVNVPFYLVGYITLMGLMLGLYVSAVAVFTYGALRASETLHRQLVDTVLGATFRWLDKTPTSRIITRATQDVSAVDTVIPELFAHMFELVFTITVRFFAILIFTPTVGLFALVIVLVGGIIGNVYVKSQLSIKRELSKAKAPVMAHFGASIAGITSIRAYGAQDAVLTKSMSLVDDYSRASLVFNGLSRWIAVRVDALGGIFAALLGVYYVYYNVAGVSASNSAFTLALAVGFGRMVLGFVQFMNMFEANGNSLERLQEYMVIEREALPVSSGVPPAHWPSSGALHVENLTASYAPEGPEVLHGLSFDVKAGERIGVVGRTGSGKSTLTLSLLRCIYTEGAVVYDGLPTSDVNLNILREKMTIIPQVPELLSGTLRRNLDPFDRFDDMTLNAALRDAGLNSVQQETQENHITLDTTISRGGSNISVGQRQIIALARAMVSDSKLLILDEATSAIDYKTDAIIQDSLRTKLSKDVTVITVAHRLQSVMDTDKIMVLDAGKIVEFDSPHLLLQKEGGFLRTLVNESEDREELSAVAAGAFNA